MCKPKFESDFLFFFNVLIFGFPWVPIDMQWLDENKKFKHVEWNDTKVLKLGHYHTISPGNFATKLR